MTNDLRATEILPGVSLNSAGGITLRPDTGDPSLVALDRRRTKTIRRVLAALEDLLPVLDWPSTRSTAERSILALRAELARRGE